MSFTKRGKPGDEPHALFQIAREHYVGARVSFVAGAVFTAQLAMQQCIETAAKAILKSTTPGRKFGGASGHKIRDLLVELAPASKAVAALLSDSDTSRVIEVLERGYNQIRYGEGVLGTDLGGALRAFDTIAGSLLIEAGRVLGYQPGLRLHVGKQTLPAFLWRLALPVRSVEHRTGIRPDDEWLFAEVLIGAEPASFS